MKPVRWREDLKVYGGPKNGQPEFQPLPVLDADMGGKPVKISAWKPEFVDWWRLLIGKPIYLMISGMAQPPISLSTKPFEGRRGHG